MIKQEIIINLVNERYIENRCKKKNKLYRDFVKYRTVNAENKYKAYKNKLTTIMRCAKKDYYTNLLMEKQSNIKNMWKVLREVIGSKMNLVSQYT